MAKFHAKAEFEWTYQDKIINEMKINHLVISDNSALMSSPSSCLLYTKLWSGTQCYAYSVQFNMILYDNTFL